MTLRLYLHKPKKVFVAQVYLDGLDPVYPQSQIVFENTSFGSYTALREGMTIRLGTAPELDDRGTLRFIQMDEFFPTIMIVVSRFSEGTNIGEGIILEGTYITAYEEYRVWAKVPRMAGSAIYKDGWHSASEWADSPPPVANAGTAVAGTVNPTSLKLRVAFNGNGSFQWRHYPHPTPTDNVSGYHWNIGTGATLIAGTLTSQEITVDFPPGFRYIYLTVDSIEYGRTHTTSIPVFASNPDDPLDESITDFQVIRHIQTRNGQEVAVDFMGDIPRNVYPDGCLMMMWDDEITFSPSDRSNIQFVGWHQQDEAYIRAEEKGTVHGTSMVFYDVCRRLETLPGFPQILEYKLGIPVGTWSQTKFPNALYYLWYLLYWHSTAMEVADFLVYEALPLGGMQFIAMASERSNLYAQVNDLAQVLLPDHLLTCSKQGQMRLVVDPQIESDKNVPNKIFPDDPDYKWQSWDDSYWTEVHFTYNRNPRVQQVRTTAIEAGVDYVYLVDEPDPVIPILGCLAPGVAPNQGEQYIENNERLVKTEFFFPGGAQEALNDYEGNRAVRYNLTYGPFQVTVPWEKAEPIIDMSLPRWIWLTVSEENRTERELPAAFVDKPLMPYEMVINYMYTETGLVRNIVFTLEEAVHGRPAQTLMLQNRA